MRYPSQTRGGGTNAGLESFGAFPSFFEALSNRSRIIDLTAKADKSKRFVTRDPKKVWALVLHQMACCYKVRDPMTRFLKMAPHFAILPDGRILQLHPILSLTGASHGFNAGSVAVEFAGNFPDTCGKWWHGPQNGQNQVTAAQIEAGRYLVRYLIRTMGLRQILAHRQSSGTRDNDPGPDIWYHVGQWAIDNLGLTDGGPGFKIDKGKPIPDIWRTWGKAKPQPEFEFGGLELETATGSCADVPVPVDRRPKLLVRGSIHSAVREVQRKLNAFHAYRLSAGLPGLRDSPLAADCNFGEHTFEAVESFQELVFPGKPIEHDGKIGPHTWAQLDAIVVGPGTSPSVQFAVEQLRIVDDGFAGALNWDQVIGLNTSSLNVQFVASGLPPAVMPSQITVEISSRAPNGAGGDATLVTALKLQAARFNLDHPANPNRIIYRLSRPLANLSDFLKVERQIKEVTTIKRIGGTSDIDFRRALGWNSRGIGTQPGTIGASTGSESSETPDAFTLFRSAGVEVLEVKVPAQPNWRVPASVKRLVRSPADVVYYSGHGLSGSGKLVIDSKKLPCPTRLHGTYHDWIGPSDLIPVWTSPMDLDVLILAGCSVLRISFTSPPSGPGVKWSQLLRAKGGPLSALLGYGSGAPCDSPNGARIAQQMAQRLTRGSTNFARDWLTVNGDNNANNAVAMDDRGYWWIEGTLTGNYDIKGPKPIP